MKKLLGSAVGFDIDFSGAFGYQFGNYCRQSLLLGSRFLHQSVPIL